MKHLIFPALLGTLFFASPYLSAQSVTVVSLGNDNTTTATNVNVVNTAYGNNGTYNLTAMDGTNEGLSMTTSGAWANAGAGGSFSPSGSANYDNSSAVINGWIAAYVTEYGDIWQSLANPNTNAQSAQMTLSGLAANTTYEIVILSVRANTVYNGTGNYQLLYDGSATGVTTSLNAGDGTITAGTATISGEMGGSASGANAREMKWAFTTGDTAGDAVLNFSGAAWNVNALIITASPIPEPSTYGIFGGLAVITCAFVLRRRKQK